MPIRLDPIDDFAERATDELPWQFRGATRMNQLMASVGCGMQLQEDDQWAVHVDTLLDVADGDALDQWGRLVNLDRLTLDDDIYRRMIRGAIPANLSEGALDEMIQIYRVLTAPSEIESIYHPPAGFRLTAYRADFMGLDRARLIKRIMKRARPGGVSITLSEAIPSPIQLSEAGKGFGHTLSRVL